MRFFYEKIRDGLLAGNCLLECLYLVTALPRNAQLFPSHVAVGSQLAVLRFAQIQHLDDAGRGQTEDLRNDLLQNVFRNLAGAEGVYPNGNRIGNADGIGELYFAAPLPNRQPRCSWRCTVQRMRRNGLPSSDPYR